jgi:hypothetical protein
VQIATILLDPHESCAKDGTARDPCREEIRLKVIDTSSVPAPQIEDERTSLSQEALRRAFLDNLFYMQGKFPALATKRDYYMALAFVVRDRLLQRWISTAAEYTKQGSRTVAYFSAELCGARSNARARTNSQRWSVAAPA